MRISVWLAVVTSSASNRPIRGLPLEMGMCWRQSTRHWPSTTRRTTLTGAVALNDFFGLAPEIDRNANPTVYGLYISDPRVYFDPQTGRFHLTVLEIDVDPATGNLA